jgi:AcrR family transcriptional regulator
MTTKPIPTPAKKRTSIGSRRNPEAEAAVLAAAKDLISERGYAGFSVDEVARRAGAGKTTIYRWYPTKADLFIAIYTAERSTFVPVPDTGNLVEELAQYTTSLWRFWASHPAGAALRGLIAEAQGTPEALSALRDRFLPDRTADVRRMLSGAAARGDLLSDEVDDKVALWVGFSWFKLLVGELHDEGVIKSVMMQIAEVRRNS